LLELLCEELGDVSECFELERIACGVEEEHSCLLSHLAFEANLGFHDERDAGATEAIRQRLPGFHWKDDAEVGNGNVMAVDGILVSFAGAVFRGGLEMRDDLVAEQVEVDPVRGAAALRTT
jgi:hypothetical protein